MFNQIELKLIINCDRIVQCHIVEMIIISFSLLSNLVQYLSLFYKLLSYIKKI